MRFEPRLSTCQTPVFNPTADATSANSAPAVVEILRMSAVSAMTVSTAATMPMKEVTVSCAVTLAVGSWSTTAAARVAEPEEGVGGSWSSGITWVAAAVSIGMPLAGMSSIVSSKGRSSSAQTT